MGNSDPNLRKLAAETINVYDRQGGAFDAQRPKKLHEHKWLQKLANLLPSGGSILDVGCGAAEPFPEWFRAQGFQVTGIDASVTMLGIARQRYPDGEWRQLDIRNLDFDACFDGLIAWHSFFHLTKDDQRRTLPRFAACLRAGGAMLLTVGPEEGEVIGHVGGEEVYHASLSPEEYDQVLHDAGMDIVEFVPEDPECDMNTLLLATKRADHAR